MMLMEQDIHVSSVNIKSLSQEVSVAIESLCMKEYYTHCNYQLPRLLINHDMMVSGIVVY